MEQDGNGRWFSEETLAVLLPGSARRSLDQRLQSRGRAEAMERTNLIGLTATRIAEVVAPLVDRPFRADQVAHWVLHRDAQSFEEMTSLPKSLRSSLADRLELREPGVRAEVESADGSRKLLFELADGITVEGVAMRDRDKITLCLSSQAGCAVGCRFCVTGALGPGRNLRPEEIVGQYRVMLRRAGRDAERVNIVFMGMGEPLLNRDSLGESLAVLYERVSPKRITVSTAGVVPGIRWLASLERRPKLAVSLNAPDQQRRAHLMPIAATYPLAQLMAALRDFPLERGRRITFEYVIIDRLNDSEDDARALVRLLRGLPSKINIIPFNEDAMRLPDLRRPTAERIDRFAQVVRDGGRTVTVRWSKGCDVAAACGQLKGSATGADQAAIRTGSLSC
jgi:23S rRNA (adenine2503-C2)-methyltransferase